MSTDPGSTFLCRRPLPGRFSGSRRNRSLHPGRKRLPRWKTLLQLMTTTKSWGLRGLVSQLDLQSRSLGR
jgi:hypothetical protein